MLNYRNYGRLWRVYGRSLFRYGTPRKVWNAARTEWAYRRWRTDVRSRPYLLHIEPLYYCNLACPLCDRERFADARPDVGRGRADTGRLSLDVFDRVLDELGDYLFQCQIFGLGEPMLDWPLTREVIRRAHGRRIFTLLSTNATPITPQVAAEVVASGLDHVACAIDGVSQEAYQRYRVGGRVEQALGGLRALAAERDRQRSGIEVEWQYLVHRYNAHEVPEAQRIADDLGVVLRCAPIGGVEHDADLQEHWLPDGAAYRDAGAAAGEPREAWHCYWLWRGAVVDSAGQVARCPGYLSLATLGRAEDGVMDIYNGADSRRARELFKPGPVADGPFPKPCDTCSFYRRHHGGPYLDKAASAGAQACSDGRSFVPASDVFRPRKGTLDGTRRAARSGPACAKSAVAEASRAEAAGVA